MKLYSYFRSSAAYRVRIALNLKSLPYEVIPVHLLKGGGEQLTEAYRKLNPMGLVPSLIDEQQCPDMPLTQSLAIIEYLEEAYPTPALLPPNPHDRAFVRSIAMSIACDIHPLNNLRVLRYLVNQLDVDEAGKTAWYRHWCEQGLAAIETMLANDSRVGRFCFGDSPTIADCCLAPQVFNADRFGCDLTGMPTIRRISAACEELEAFQHAAPSRQPDSE